MEGYRSKYADDDEDDDDDDDDERRTYKSSKPSSSHPPAEPVKTQPTSTQSKPSHQEPAGQHQQPGGSSSTPTYEEAKVDPDAEWTESMTVAIGTPWGTYIHQSEMGSINKVKNCYVKADTAAMAMVEGTCGPGIAFAVAIAKAAVSDKYTIADTYTNAVSRGCNAVALATAMADAYCV
eukprot:TRINITY_DN27058_c0_g1_i6.p4 TRINITY_DN27058_c0_g1~~TRINITY_DN27058_c0_g1_i6.p4  ORF type:complete len:179 (+),score=34.21 TRINITY_DN27058_c0_g1_i6:533-1069(+)